MPCHVKGQSLVDTADLPYAHTGKGSFAYREAREDVFVLRLALDEKREDLFGYGQERNNRLYIGLLSLDAYLCRAGSVAYDVLGLETLHIYPRQPCKGTEDKE